MKRMIESFLIFIVVILMLVSSAVALAPHLGLTVGEIASGSMEPTLDIGTMIVANKVNPEQLVDGDIIVFQPTGGESARVCHRILAVNYTPSLVFTTKGDNNPVPDSFIIPAENVAGRVIFHLPVLGYLVQFLQTSTGLLVGLIAPAMIIIALCLRALRQELKKWVRDKAAKEAGHD